MLLRRSCCSTCLILCLLVNSVYCTSSGSKTQLYVGGMFPLGTRFGNLNGSELASICNVAVEMVNNRSNILTNYNLNLIYNDTKCDKGTGTRILIEYLMRRPPVIMILGPGCSSVSRTVAQVAWQWNVNQISYGSTASDLSNIERYPLLYRVMPPDSVRIAALISFLKYNEWQRIAVIADNSGFNEIIPELTQELTRNNFTIVVTERISDNSRKHLDQLKEKEARIIIALVNQDTARHLFCQAYKIGLYGKQYVWFFPFWYGSQWWENDSSHCTNREISQVALGNFFIDSIGVANNNDKGVSGMNRLEIQNLLRKKLGLPTSNFALFAFDAVWAMASALHNAAEELMKINKTLGMFTYNDKNIGDVIRASLQMLSFQGTTGCVKFNSHGARKIAIKIHQLQNDDLVTVAQYNSVSEKLSQNNSIVWQGSRPLDGQQYQYKILFVTWPLFWCIVGLTSCAVLLTLILLVFNAVHRNKSHIKLSSPNINNVVLLGAIAIYASIFMILIDSRIVHENKLPFLCSITGFLLGIGYSLFVGAMFSKAWRVYQLYNRVYTRRKVFTEKQLVALVILFVVMDIFLFTLWTTLDPFYVSFKRVNHLKESRKTIIYQFQYCETNHMTTWYYVILGYKVLILLVGSLIAMATRKFKAKSLNDSQLIGASICIVTFAACIGLPLNFVIADRNTAVVVFCFILLLATSASLCIIFIPKIRVIFSKKKGNVYHLESQLNVHDDFNNRHSNKDLMYQKLDSASLKKEIPLQNDLDHLGDNEHAFNSCTDSLDGGTPSSARKAFGSRSNTVKDLTDSPKLKPANHHRRYNTISVPPKLDVALSYVDAKDEEKNRDLKVENASLRRKLHQTKISEAGKMCKVLYENAELNRKIVELSMAQNDGHDNMTETLSRLTKENNELKRQLGEVSILNSVCDTTPRMKRKGTDKNRRDLKELQHLLTVDLGGGRASSLRTKRPPPVGVSQSALIFSDPKETRNDKDANTEQKANSSIFNNNNKENKPLEDNKQEKDGSEVEKAKEANIDVYDQNNEIENDDNEMPVREECIGQSDNQGFLDDQGSSETTKTAGTNYQNSEGSEVLDSSEVSEMPVREDCISQGDNQGFLDDQESSQNTKTADINPPNYVDTEVYNCPDVFSFKKAEHSTISDDIRSAYEQSKTKELLGRCSSEISQRTSHHTAQQGHNTTNNIKTENDPCICDKHVTSLTQESRESRAIVGGENSDCSHSPSLDKDEQLQQDNGVEYGINRKQRKSKRDKKTKIERVEKTFFV